MRQRQWCYTRNVRLGYRWMCGGGVWHALPRVCAQGTATALASARSLEHSVRTYPLAAEFGRLRVAKPSRRRSISTGGWESKTLQGRLLTRCVYGYARRSVRTRRLPRLRLRLQIFEFCFEIPECPVSQ